jgi:ubiquinone/menaquinone biosynthesis C-methylase UbiE
MTTESDHRTPASPALDLPGVHRSPNIQTDADVYEVENNAVDPDQLIEREMWRIAPWDDKVVLDLGSGTGFHVPRFHRRASHVIGIEPHGASHLRAMARASSLGLERASLVRGSAVDIPLRDASVDVVHARFAYFFGPGCEPGLAELQRVVRPNGTAFIIDNDLSGGEFAAWLRMEPAWADVSPSKSEEFFRKHGFKIERIQSEWRFKRREDLEAVVRLEFSADVADRILRQHSGTRVSYQFLLIYRRY